MSLEYLKDRLEKPGITREATAADHLWLQGLIRYTDNAELATSTRVFYGAENQMQPESSMLVPNMVTVAANFTSQYKRGELSFLFRSFAHTDHSRYIAEAAQAAGLHGARQVGGIAIKLYNSNSQDLALAAEGEAFIPPDGSDEAQFAWKTLVRAHTLKSSSPITRDERRVMHVIHPLRVFTQGQRMDENGEFVGEGHPCLQPNLLTGFEDLPALLPGMRPPDTRVELFAFLRGQNYQHPVLG